MTLLTERYAPQIAGVLSCFDRIVSTGTLPGVCLDEGMANRLYYFYFIGSEFGLCYPRVPTWAPFSLQLYCNGHNHLAGQLQQAGIAFAQMDNTFSSLADFSRAQALFDAFPIERLHRALDGLAAHYCPVAGQFGTTYHWGLMQVEYSTDVVFHLQADPRPLHETLVRSRRPAEGGRLVTAIHAVKPDNVATFLFERREPADLRLCSLVVG